MSPAQQVPATDSRCRCGGLRHLGLRQRAMTGAITNLTGDLIVD